MSHTHLRIPFTLKVRGECVNVKTRGAKDAANGEDMPPHPRVRENVSAAAVNFHSRISHGDSNIIGKAQFHFRHNQRVADL